MIHLKRTLFEDRGDNQLKPYVKSFSRIFLKDLKNNLNKKGSYTLFYNLLENNEELQLVFMFWRLDIIKELKKKYKTETYVLNIEKGKPGFDSFHSDELLIDERHEFHTVEEIIDYLDEKGYLKREDWINNE